MKTRLLRAVLSCLGLSLLSTSAWVAGGLSFSFDTDSVGSPPQGVFSSGIGGASSVKVVQDEIRAEGDLSVEFGSQGRDKHPCLALSAPDGGFPVAGSIFFDLVAKENPIRGAFHVTGLTSEGRTAFHFLVASDGSAALRTAEGDTPFATYIPQQWYIQRLDYNLGKGEFSIVLDCYYASGITKTLGLNAGETFEKIVFQGESDVPSRFCLDSVRLFMAGQKNEGGAPSLGSFTRKIRWETPLSDPTPAVIVYPSGMEGGWECARQLRGALAGKLGKHLACLSDRTVTDADTWLLKDRYLSIPMIVLGNAVDSRAIYALSTRFLARSNHVWPGRDRFCNRAVLEPFRRDVNHILLEASTLDGLRAAVDSFGARIASLKGAGLAVSYFRDLGAATGEWKEKPFRRSGLDLSKPLEDIKEQILKKYGKTVMIRPGGVYCYPAWDWLNGYSAEAAKYASAVLLILLDRLGPDRFYNGHYNFDRAFKAWQICFTSGAVPESVINRVEAAMVQQAAYPQDYHASSLRTHAGKRIARHADRHMISSLSNYLCGTDYVLSHCRLNQMTGAMVAEYDRAYRRIVRRFIDSFRCNNVTSESGDSAVCVLNMMALTGNLEYVRSGTLARAVENLVASVNNFGSYTGEGPYIGSYTLTSRCTGKSLANAAAFYYRDPCYRWVSQHVQAQACCVAHENPVFESAGEEQFPDRHLGVRALAFDARIFRALETPEPLPGNWGGMKCVPTGLPVEDLFDRAFFRDGFEPQDAFLSLMGTPLTSTHQMLHSNAIIQYTDLGKILLYTHAQLTDGWVRNTLSASNGRPAKPTFACLRKALINSDDVSAISSVCPNNGNTEWTRTILHRRGHYFVALDRADALDAGDYTFTCRWRTLFPQQLRDGVCTVDAGDGVTLDVISADAVLQHSVRTEPDGTTRPYLLSQYRKANLQRGSGVSFKNLFYARSPERPDRCRVRAAGENCVMVHGKGNDWEEVALIGTGASPDALKSLKIEADIFYATATQVVAANCRELEIMGKSALPPDGVGGNTTVPLVRVDVGAELATFFAGLKPPGAVPAETTQDHGFREEWGSNELVFPQVRCKPTQIVSQPPAAGLPIEDLTGGLQRFGLAKVRHVSHWRTPGRPVDITLDLGRVQGISEVHFVGPIADNYRTKFYYEAGDVRFSMAYSNDSFKDDIRNVPAPEIEFREQTFPYAQYTWAGRLPLFVVKAGVKARFIKVSAVTDKPALAFQKIFVIGQDTQPELFCDLQAADLDGDGASELVGTTTNGEIFAMSATGKKMWSRLFPGVITAWNAVDLENDARQELLVYTTEDACYVLEGDGKERWRVDFYEYARQQNPEAWGRDWSKYCLSFVTAWRPDAKTGRKEVFGFGHTTVTSIRPDLAIDSTIGSGHVNKFAVSDTSVLGREVLAGGGFNFTLMDRARETIVKVPMPGKLAGNGQLPVFIAVVPVSNEKAKGFMAMNVSSLLWAPAGRWEQGWEQFSDVPITAYALSDLDADGCEELVIGCKDGFLRVYRITDGQILTVVSSGSAPVAGLVALRDGRLVTASRIGVSLFDKSLRQQAFRNIQATDIAVLKRANTEIVCVSDNRGRIHALAPDTSLP